MAFQSWWQENAEAPPVYIQGVGIGRSAGAMALAATLGALTFSGAMLAGGYALSLAATLGALTLSSTAGPGVTVYKAVWDLVNAGLNVFIVRERSDAVPYDYVISWSPSVGSLLAPYSRVTLTVSDGPVNAAPTTSAVPNVTGVPTWQAVETIAASGFSLDEYTWAIDASDAGTVIGQSPAAGTQAVPGAIMTLTVSLGPTPVTPPVPVPI